MGYMEWSNLEQSGLECICVEEFEACGEIAWSGRNLCGLISGQVSGIVWCVWDVSGLFGLVWSSLQCSGVVEFGVAWNGLDWSALLKMFASM